MTSISFLFFALCLTSGVFARKGFGPGEQEWGYVKVRPNANTFWWLYYTTANVPSYYDKPLMIWLQGGPGGSSTSYGNFEELGPLDVNLVPRNYTWVKDYNVLFIDNPVGTGFSYVTSPSGYATTNAQIARDLVECMKSFMKKLPGFSKVPTYIMTESYGGKMGAEFALLWHKEERMGLINSNLRGVALGDAWISPIDSVMTWADFLLATGMVDTDGFRKIDEAARLTKNAVERADWEKSTALWGYTEGVIMKVSNNVDFYNILKKIKHSGRTAVAEYASEHKYTLNSLMNGPVKKALGLNVTHGVQSGTVFDKLRGDFMKPVVDIVETLLNQTNLKVAVISGHLDLIVDTPGTLIWVENMKWRNSASWHKSQRRPLVGVNNIIEGYQKVFGNFAMYWVNRAGHMVPSDNPMAMAEILKAISK